MAPSRWVGVIITVSMLFSMLLAGPGLAQDTTAEPPVNATPETTESAPVETTPEAPATEDPFISYTVVSGDTLARIATRFNTTVAVIVADNGILNPNVVTTGTVLRIRREGAPTPAPTATATPAPAETTAPGGTTTYIVVPGDTLFRIATRFNSNVAEMMALNNLADASLIYVGQALLVPSGEGAPVIPTTAPQQPVATAEPTAEATPPVELDPNFGYGLHVYANPANAAEVAQAATELGVGWIRVEARWRDFEPVQGTIDFERLDGTLQPFFDAGLDVLLTIASAPDWARTSTDESGPPDNLQQYATFVGQVAERYAGRVSAYEIWSEPNLRREWNSSVHSISAESYIDLLQQAYVAIKAVDPDAVVVSAGPAPTGFNDGVNAINDRLYLQALYQNGLADVSDAIGAHPGGWANPPDSVCCQPAVGIETHYEDPSFYFLDTLSDYRDIMVAAGDANTAIWVTEFGWGTSEDTEPPSAIYVYVTYTSRAEQAIYTPRAFSLGEELGYIGPMFVNNLNGCQGEPGNAEVCYYSLLGPDGAARPVYNAILALDKSGDAPDLEATAAPDGSTDEQPAGDETAEQEPLALTATAIIGQATATAAAAPVETEELANG